MQIVTFLLCAWVAFLQCAPREREEREKGRKLKRKSDHLLLFLAPQGHYSLSEVPTLVPYLNPILSCSLCLKCHHVGAQDFNTRAWWGTATESLPEAEVELTGRARVGRAGEQAAFMEKSLLPGCCCHVLGARCDVGKACVSNFVLQKPSKTLSYCISLVFES